MGPSSARSGETRWLPGRLALALPAAALLVVALVLPWRGDAGGTQEVARARQEAGDAAPDLETLPAGGPDAPTLAGRTPVESPPSTNEARVHVVGRFGAPLAGYTVRVWRGDAGEERASDADGVVRVADVVLDGSVVVEARPPWRGDDPTRGRSVALDAADVTLRVEVGTDLELDLRDVETGDRVTGGRWRYGLRMLGYESPWSPGGEALPLRMPAGGRALVVLEVEPPPGHVSWDTLRHWVHVDAATRRIRIVHPLRREARLVVDATRTMDGSAADPVLLGFVAPPRQIHVLWRLADAHGLLTVPGVPFLPGCPVRVVVGDGTWIDTYPQAPGSTASRRRTPGGDPPPRAGGVVVVEGELGARFSEEVLLQPVVLPVAARERGFDFSRRDTHTTEWQAPLRYSGTIDPHAEATGTVEVQVLDADGTPLADVDVDVRGNLPWWQWRGRTDGEGTVRFPRCAAGTAGTASLVDLRRLPATARFDVAADTVTRVTLREPAGGRLRLRVVDAQGRPIPYATVRFPGVTSWPGMAHWDPCAKWEDGVLVVDPYADAFGRWESRPLRQGSWRVEAYEAYAEHEEMEWTRWVRQATGRIEIREGLDTDLELVLTRPER